MSRLCAMGILLCTLAAAGCSTDNGGPIQFTASGEVLALGGYSFPPAGARDPAFVDGWEVRFSEVIVTVDKITLSENPDKSPTDQSQTDAKVAEVDGPWAIDLHKGGPLMGKGGSGEQALAIAMVSNQNQNGNKPFDASKRYAFGFDLVPATASAMKLNLDAQGTADYNDMVQKGYVVLYVGTATFKGTSCASTNPSYDFSRLPQTVNFRFGFKSPTTYINCQNPDNDPAKPFGMEEHQRGVHPKANTTAIAQVTVHTDHPFWESTKHDSPAHFDPLAARAVRDSSGNFNVTLDSVTGVSFMAFRDAIGNPMPWRSCLSTYMPPNSSTSMGFDSQGVVLADYAAYMLYNQSTQGHLNSDGLCFVKRNYPSPP